VSLSHSVVPDRCMVTPVARREASERWMGETWAHRWPDEASIVRPRSHCARRPIRNRARVALPPRRSGRHALGLTGCPVRKNHGRLDDVPDVARSEASSLAHRLHAGPRYDISAAEGSRRAAGEGASLAEVSSAPRARRNLPGGVPADGPSDCFRRSVCCAWRVESPYRPARFNLPRPRRCPPGRPFPRRPARIPRRAAPSRRR
jgi:hypothetical protein